MQDVNADEQKQEEERREKWIQIQRVDATIGERAHRILADKSRRRNFWLGVPVVILTTLVGTSSFASIADLGKARVSIAIATGLVAVATAVLAALQTFLQFAEAAKSHSEAAAKLAQINKMYAYLQSLPPVAIEQGGLYDLDSNFSDIVKNSPAVPLDIEATVRKQLIEEWGAIPGVLER